MPTDLNLRALDQTTIELTWKAPADDAGRQIPDGYRIDYSEDGMVWYSLAPAVATSASPKYVDQPGSDGQRRAKFYRIFAFNTGGSSSPMLGAHEHNDHRIHQTGGPDGPGREPRGQEEINS